MLGSTTRAPKPIAALAHAECLDAVRAASRAFATATNMPPEFASRSWFLCEFARLLGHGKRSPRPGARRSLQVQTEATSTRLGNFRELVGGATDRPIDVLACPGWGRLELSDDDYGTDERFLPPFYIIKLSFDRQDGWVYPEDVAGSIPGPLTVTVVHINLLGAERAFHAARNFERSMTARSVPHLVSTQFIVPGLLAAVTAAERTEPHQTLIASQAFDRAPIANPRYDGAGERRPWRE